VLVAAVKLLAFSPHGWGARHFTRPAHFFATRSDGEALCTPPAQSAELGPVPVRNGCQLRYQVPNVSAYLSFRHHPQISRETKPRRTNAHTGAELFIVDNSDDEWKALRYIKEWCEISRSIDVATAYFEIGSLLALDGQWQKTDAIRVLMGHEVAQRTKNAIARAIRQKMAILDSSIECEKERDDFLTRLPAIVRAIQNGQMQFRVHRRKKFHAKAYISGGFRNEAQRVKQSGSGRLCQAPRVAPGAG
jgi:hypothetical protein